MHTTSLGWVIGKWRAFSLTTLALVRPCFSLCSVPEYESNTTNEQSSSGVDASKVPYEPARWKTLQRPHVDEAKEEAAQKIF